MYCITKFALGLTYLLGLLAMTVMAHPVNEADPYELVRAISSDDSGIVLLGSDGVLRSFAANLTVLSYAKLSSPQIQKLIDDQGRDETLSKAFEGVSGHDVVDEQQLEKPGKGCLPVNWNPKLAIQEMPGTSKNPALQLRDEDASLKKPKCPHSRCYGKGNCSPACRNCFSPYPGQKGVCIS